MIIFIIHILERVGTWFIFIFFQPGRVSLEICLTAPSYFSMVFEFVKAVTFLAFWPINVTHKYWVIPFLAILILWDAWVHVYISDYGNVLFYIKASVDKQFCFCTILRIPNVYPDHGHVNFGKSFDNVRLGC